jgi:hypothetical protein
MHYMAISSYTAVSVADPDPDPDLDHFGKLDPDPNPHPSGKLVPDLDPHQSEKVKALEVILECWRVQISEKVSGRIRIGIK